MLYGTLQRERNFSSALEFYISHTALVGHASACAELQLRFGRL